ncbi:MAG: CXXX repeat peptide maturase [Prevotella sp.]|nr:CXXX repeat peptide maturase [Prevotella sp.]MCM1074778.1 CXXX repeat peptide maturase [Ruminococcus sp.]
MLKYLIIQTCDSATSFCHYDNNKSESKLIDLDALKRALLWSMKENLNVQFVLPDTQLPHEYEEVMDTVDSAKVASAKSEYAPEADVVVFNSWEDFTDFSFQKNVAYVVRTSFADLQTNKDALCAVLPKVDRLNVVLTDAAQMTDDRNEAYSGLLDSIAESVKSEYLAEHPVQLNLLTDRLMLTAMNNCNAGWESIALAPNGKYYVCPAFYFEDETDSVGNVENGLDIKNPQLYRLDHAPICRNCDAWHCRRCAWLNRQLTLEVNTPSHEQCVTAHLERNASARLLTALTAAGLHGPGEADLKETECLDPFEEIINK